MICYSQFLKMGLTVVSHVLSVVEDLKLGHPKGFLYHLLRLGYLYAQQRETCSNK